MRTAETKSTSKTSQKQANNPFFGKGGDSFFEKPIQAKLNIGKPNDPYEKEADSMADKVVQRMSTGKVSENEQQKEKVNCKPIFESENEAPVQRKCDHCEEEEKKEQKEEEKSEGEIVQRVTCRECEEGDKVLMKPIEEIQRSEEDQTPKNDGSRTSILAAAQGEVGKVHARLDDGTGQRMGADRLAEYFKIAAPDVWDESIIRTAGAKMPSWCGIFSVWAHKKAGKNLGNWQMGKGVSAFGTLTQTDSPQPGDIGYIHKPNQHHAVVKEVQGDKILTIDGNSGLNSEVIENTKPRSAYTGFMTAFAGGGDSGDVQKKEEPEEHIQQKSAGENATASPSVENKLHSSKGKGESLPEPVRQQMEQSFDADFSKVRIHTGSEAKGLSKDLKALAFTHGHDIYFNNGKFSPDSQSGKHLLAHELTHVVQQNGAQPAVQKKEEQTICDEDGKKRPKSPPSAANILTSKYGHLAKVIKANNLDSIQKCLDAQFKISELREKQKPFKDRLYFQGGTPSGLSSDVAKYNSFEKQIGIQGDIIQKNYQFFVDAKLLAADDIKRPAGETNEVMLAFHETMYKRFTDTPVRITVNPCQYDESNVFNQFLMYDWEAHPRMFWRLGHYNGLVTFRNLMAWQKWNIDYQKVHIGEMIKILEHMMELRREIGDSMYDVVGKKLGEKFGVMYNNDVTIGQEIGSSSGYMNDGVGYQNMYNDLMKDPHGGMARVVLMSKNDFLHIFALDPNFDTTEMQDPGNEGQLMVLEKGRAAGLNVYEDYFFTKDGRRLKPHTNWSEGKGWATPRELSELEEFAIGAILGDAFDSNSGTATFGQIVIGLIPIVGQIADARDVCVGIHKIYESGGKDGKMQTAFALIGFVPLFGDWIKRAAKVGKNAEPAVKAAAKTDAVVKGSEKMGGGVTRTSGKQIENAAEKGGKKGVEEALQTPKKVGNEVIGASKKFVSEVMVESGKVTDDVAKGLSKTDSLAGEAASAHGRKLSDLANPKVLAESSFKIGDQVHAVKVVEIGNMKQLWLCSTCGSLVGKIDEALATAKGPAADKLKRLRDSAAELERKVTNGEIKPADVDKKVGRITFELNDLARKNPDMAGLTKLLREDLERQYKLAYGVDDVSKLTEGAKQALAKNYRPTPPGYHWRWDGKQLEVVRNPGNPGSKLIYEEAGHRFIVDEGGTAARKLFGDIDEVAAFAELGGKDLSSDFGKFVKTIGEEFQIPPQRFIDDLKALKEAAPKGFKDAAQDAIRHKLKARYVDMLFAKITNVAELAKSPTYKSVLASTKDVNKALRAASHEELMKVSKKLGASDKGSLGEKWFKEWFASRGEQVAKQVTLGPQHGIKHAASRRVDIYEDHLAREMKNVTGSVGKEGADQLEDLMAGIGKEITVDGVKTGYDSVRWVFLDPVGGAANASWMTEQLGKYGNSNLTFQVLNNQGIPRVFSATDLAKLGPEELKKAIVAWTGVKPKLFGAASTAPDEREADTMADKVVQQIAAPVNMIQKDDDDAAADPGATTIKSLYDSLVDFHAEHSDMVDDITDNDEKAVMRRMLLLLEIEMENAQNQTSNFQTEKEREEVVSSVLETAESQAESEQTAMEIIINAKSLPVTPATFLDHPYFLENAGAFPKAFWEILSPLIAVQPDQVANAESDAKEALRLYQETSQQMTDYLFEHGLPVSYNRSLQLSQYELIKSGNYNERIVAMMFYKQRPSSGSDLDFLVMPEETDLHKGNFALYQLAWTNYVIKKYLNTAYKYWLGSYNNMYRNVMAGDIPAVNINKLKAFKEKNPDGLYNLDDLLKLGSGSAIGDMALAAFSMMADFDPETYLLFTKSNAANAASNEASGFIGDEIKKFFTHQYTASGKIQSLDPNDRLIKAIDWSLEQGFTQQNIQALIDNFGSLLEDLLEEFVEESIWKRVISFVATLHPLGRVIAIAYNVYKTIEDISDAVDTGQAIMQVAGIIDDARNATTVVQTQRAAAQLAFATQILFPIILEKLSAAMAKRLTKGAKKPDPADPNTTTGTTPPAPTGGTASTVPDIDPHAKPGSHTRAPDKPANPDTPDKNATNTKTKVNADPPKQLHESKFNMGGETHTVRVVEMGGRKQIWVCTTCGNLVGKLDEAIAEAQGDVKKQLERYRRSAFDLEEKINSGKKINPSDIDKKVGRISYEVNKIARKNPDLSSLNRILKEDLERQYIAAYGKTSIDDLTPASAAALAAGYRPTPPGYHWRQGDNNKLEVVRNPDGEVKKKLKYDDKEHRFIEDPEIKAPAKKFSKNMTAKEAFEEMGGIDPKDDFGKFVNTTANELGISRDELIRELHKQNPNGFHGKTHNNVRHKLKEQYVKKLYEKTIDQDALRQTEAYKNELAANKGNEEAALKAASHAKMLDISRGLGAGDKGSLGEKWFKENFAQRGEDVATQAVLGPEQGIVHKDQRKVDIYEDHLAREVKNVTGSLGQEGAEQVEDLLAGVDKDIKVNGKNTGYDSVRLVFLDPVGGAANASWMTKQLADHKDKNLSFQVMNSKGKPMVITPADLVKFGGEAGLQKKIYQHLGIQKKSINGNDNSQHEQVAERMANNIIARKTTPFFGPEQHRRTPFFNKYN